MQSTFASRIRSSWIDANPVMKMGVADFHRPREENETDLVASCREALVQAGLEAQVLEHWDTNSNIKEAMPLGLNSQRFILNRYWQLQLFSIEADTQKERFCLIDQGTAEEWLRCFKDVILPTVVSNNLPQAL